MNQLADGLVYDVNLCTRTQEIPDYELLHNALLEFQALYAFVYNPATEVAQVAC